MKDGDTKTNACADGRNERQTERQTERRTLPAHLGAQLDALDGKPDTADIPEAPAANWADARRFHRVRKEPISIRLDADVLDWLRRRHDRYQVEINRILRERMEAEAG